MARYPFFNYYLNNLSNEDGTKLYSEVKEWGSILIRELDKKGDLSKYLSYLDSLNEDDALRIIRLGGSYNKGG